MDITINYLAVFVAAISSMVIGFIWYGPLFGKKYMHEMGMSDWSEEKKAKMKKAMTMTYVWQFIGSLVMFYVLASFIGATGRMTLMGGLSTAFCVWLGFIVPVKLSDAIWGGKMSLFWLGIGGMLVTLLAAGAIIGAWN